ncbi:MAG: 3D domain-containing protein [Candidatus Paceibacterota bacterium]|jgi:3D (Asp-Asp-Asp) domain-containing protein
MSKPNRCSPSFKALWLNRAFKTSSLSLILIFVFFSRFSNILVEGSLSTIISDSEVQSSNDTNAPYFEQNETGSYLSTQTFLLEVNPTFTSLTTKRIVATAYSSTPDQTDDTPFITASGKMVGDGIVASNFLAFGTKLRMPELFGNKIFVVEDRMNKRFSSDRIDIWFPDRETARIFGIKETTIEIFE